MKKLIVIVSLLLSTFVNAQPAPDFALNNANLPATLAGLKGQVVYIDFWASWCTPCRKSFPWLNKVQKEFEDQGFTVIAVNVDVDKVLSDEFLQEVPANFPIVYDPKGKIAKAYQLVGMPSSYIVNRNGDVVVAHVGFYSEKTSKYQTEIEALLKETNVKK